MQRLASVDVVRVRVGVVAVAPLVVLRVHVPRGTAHPRVHGLNQVPVQGAGKSTTRSAYYTHTNELAKANVYSPHPAPTFPHCVFPTID